MLSSIEEIELLQMIDDKIKLGNHLQKSLESFIHIEGAYRIQKKISREIKYLEKVRLFVVFCGCEPSKIIYPSNYGVF